MRACEGCRRRKIKCDAATTNTWPCSACIRLKLHCVPPTINYDSEFSTNGQGFQTENVEYESAGSGDDEYQQQILRQQQQQQQLSATPRTAAPTYAQQVPYTDPIGVYQPSAYVHPPLAHGQQTMYNSMQNPVDILNHQQQYSQQQVFPQPPLQRHNSHPESPETYDQDPYGRQDLSDLLGDLKMNESGSGWYSSNGLDEN